MTQQSCAVPPATSNETAGEKLSLFQKIADKVSYGMGTPQNITIWIILVGTWITLGPFISRHNFLPAWFTSNSFNFPLNSVTTVLELYIGFLVGASSNRSERNLENTLAAIGAQEAQIQDVEAKLAAEMAENTRLTAEVHALTTTIAGQTATLDEIHRHVQALAPRAGQFPAPGTGRGGSGAETRTAGGGAGSSGNALPGGGTVTVT
jgi:cell division protein FtsB